MARILVTGSEGLVGRAARRWLTLRGHEVIGLDVALPEDHPERGDIVDHRALAARCRDADGIVHLAAVARVRHAEADPERCWSVNVVGTGSVIAAALALNLAKLEPSPGSMRGKLKRAGWDNAFLARLLAQFASPQMRSPWGGLQGGLASPRYSG